MADTKYRALVVDDDPTIQKLSALALEEEGFNCTTAGNGLQAMDKIATTVFDLVIVDLAMPHRHGHSVAVELLEMPKRPAIAILTGLVEPRILKDLMARGVDDVVAKPVNFTMFAAKMKSLVSRRREAVEGAAGQNAAAEKAVQPVSISDLNQRLLGMSCILPLSCIAVDVYEMTSDHDGDTTRVSAALERDPALLAEVLRLANSPRHNPQGDKVLDVERAVAMIGQKYVGELALANHALGAITSTVVPWINAPLLSRRSIAAGIALEVLATREESDFEGLLAAAIMHSLGRVVLGSLYPVQYGAVNEYCRKHGCALATAERLIFPETSAETLARLLQSWNVPKEICEPIAAIGQTYQRLGSLTGVNQSRAELLKVAILIGELAVGQWDPWDVLEFPSKAVLGRLGIQDIGSCIAEVRADLQPIERFRSSGPAAGDSPASQPAAPTVKIRVGYRDLWPDAGKMLRPVLQSLSITCLEGAQDLPLVLNAIGTEHETIKRQMSTRRKAPVLAIVDSGESDSLGENVTILSLPCSYAQLRDACKGATQLQPTGGSPIGASAALVSSSP